MSIERRHLFRKISPDQKRKAGVAIVVIALLATTLSLYSTNYNLRSEQASYKATLEPLMSTLSASSFESINIAQTVVADNAYIRNAYSALSNNYDLQSHLLATAVSGWQTAQNGELKLLSQLRTPTPTPRP